MKIKIKDLIWNFIVSIGIVILFTLIDYAIHLIPYFNVPNSYFINKLIFGFIISFFLITVLRLVDIDNMFNTLSFSMMLTLLLGIRYIFLYSILWNILILSIHFIILVPISYLAFKFLELD